MGFEYDEFDIIETAIKCGIQFYPYQKNHVEFKALCPFCGDKKYHLGLNRKKGMFNCFYCKEHGNSVSLYAKVHGISNIEAYQILKSEFGAVEANQRYFYNNTEMPIRSIEERHNVYYDFLNLLELKPYHRYNLEMRGLSTEHINQFMYRSIPTDGEFRREVIYSLASLHKLAGIPGFWRDDYGNVQMYYKKTGGIFIPICNKDGYIQGLQMRLDVPDGSDEKKFRWFSSRHFKDGTGAKPWIHVVGDVSCNTQEACITEGGMKADVASVLSNGRLFIAVPGVNELQYLPDVIRELRVKKLYECFDMDKFSNPSVNKALTTLRKMIADIGVEYTSCSWDSKYKGIDNYLLAKSMHMQQKKIAA